MSPTPPRPHAPLAPLLTPHQAATRLGLDVDVLAELRRVGRGPDHLQLDDHTIRYSPAALTAWRSQ